MLKYDSFGRPDRPPSEYGGIAQLGERLNGIQEVSGSIPLISTKNPEIIRFQDFFFVRTATPPRRCMGGIFRIQGCRSSGGVGSAG